MTGCSGVRLYLHAEGSPVKVKGHLKPSLARAVAADPSAPGSLPSLADWHQQRTDSQPPTARQGTPRPCHLTKAMPVGFVWEPQYCSI